MTSATYRLFRMTERASDENGFPFPTGGRTVWTVTVLAGRVDVAVAVVIEWNAGEDEAGWNEATTISVAAVGPTVRPTGVAGFAIPAHAREIRARFQGTAGVHAIEVVAAGPFFDTNDGGTDLAMIDQRLREFSGRVDVIEDAEADVLDLMDPNEDGYLDADMARAGFLAEMKRVIARQAEHVFRRAEMARGKDEESQVAAARMGQYGRGVKDRTLRLRLSAPAPRWRGR